MGMLLRRTIGEHITLKMKFTDETTTAIVGRTLLESAIINLVVNSRDAMPDGGTLIIKTATGEPSGRRNSPSRESSMISIIVTDTGSGMPPDVVHRACEPFFTTKDPGKGSG
jgi:signal transduction histidine kinase